MPKPDDRSDNVDKLQRSIANTQENLHEAEDFVNAHDNEMSERDKADIRAKNRKRARAIEGFRSEIEDELDSQ